MCYNILNNLVDIDADAYFKRSKVHHTRGNNMKLNKYHASSVRHNHFFTHRVINIWYSLPSSIVISPTAPLFEFYAMMLRFLFLLFLFFPFRAPVRASLSLPWCPVGTLCFCTCLYTCYFLCVTNKLDWIGLHG